MAKLSLVAVEGMPLIVSGDNVAALIIAAGAQPPPGPSDVIVVAQKIVSKAEGQLVKLSDVTPSPAALALASEAEKDPRLVELILSQSRQVIRVRPGVIIVEHKQGTILANAGIDTSNIYQAEDDAAVLLWPEDPDASAQRLSTALAAHFGFPIPVIISDSIGRAWRLGTIGHAIGCAGLDPLWNQAGQQDLMGNTLRVTEPATADALAAAAALVQGEANEGLPVVWIKGCSVKSHSPRPATALLRDSAMDMFR